MLIAMRHKIQVVFFLAAMMMLPTGSATADTAPADQSLMPEGGCCGICCNMCPCRYGYVEGLILDRNNQAANQPLVLNQNTGATLLSVGNLSPGIGGGVRVLAGARFNDCWAAEFGYFGIFGQQANATVNLQDSILIPGDLGLNVNNFQAADQATLQYTSTLNSAEANLVHCCCCCDCCGCRSVEWLVGFRYLNLNEHFSLTTVDSAESTSRYAVRTNNNLSGAQTGARLRRCYGLWSFEGTGKAGIFGNAAHQSSDPILDFPNNFVRRGATSASVGQVAFVGDLNFTAIRQLTDVWGLRFGYNLIWIEGVALAPNQLDFTFTPTSGTGINSTGGVFMHGANIGLEARW